MLQIVYDIINGCGDPAVTQSVCKNSILGIFILKKFQFFPIRFFNPQLIQLSLQLQCHRPIATCGLFVFDWTLLFTVDTLKLSLKVHPNSIDIYQFFFQMFAATTTYLTILLNLESTTTINSQKA